MAYPSSRDPSIDVRVFQTWEPGEEPDSFKTGPITVVSGLSACLKTLKFTWV